MSEELKVETPVEEKQTNKMFTQSEFDKMVATKEKEIMSKFSDYSDLKTKAESFAKLQAEQEQAKLTEVEKAQKRSAELEQLLNQERTEKQLLSKKTMKLEVLSDAKFGVLPGPYKAMIDGDTVEAIREAAELQLKDFHEILKNANNIKQIAVGLPPPAVKETMVKAPSIRELYAERMAKRASLSK
jgi:hypothetical protein